MSEASKANTVSYNEFIDIFTKLVLKRFEYHDTLQTQFKVFTDVYVYRYQYENTRYTMYLTECKDAANYNILSKWVYGFVVVSYITKFLEISYENVNIDDLEKYIQILLIRKPRDYHEYINILNLHKKAINLTFEEFLLEYYKFGYMKNFEEYIIEKSNARISKLWDIWWDYSGEYKTYIEWFPREIIDNFLMLKHNGKYQPDFTTYIE